MGERLRVGKSFLHVCSALRFEGDGGVIELAIPGIVLLRPDGGGGLRDQPRPG